MATRLLICDCGGTQRLDREGLAEATGLDVSRCHSALCTGELNRAAATMGETSDGVIVACAQEAQRFEALAAEIGAPAPLTVDIRDRAGWSEDGGIAAGAKIAALVALAQRRRRPAHTMDVVSDGVCLILGGVDTVLPVAEQLAAHLAVTCLVPDAAEVVPRPRRSFDVVSGRLVGLTGAIGNFEVAIDGFRSAIPGGRGALGFAPPKDGARSVCDLVLDLSGAAPRFPAHEKRDGYLRADPGDPVAVQKAVFAAAQLVGTFEKTLHVTVEPSLCAHSRAEKTACTRCLDLCPTGAIQPDGEAVRIDPLICAGCGACSAACPSGAVSYADPAPDDIFAEVTLLAERFREAGGRAPRLLVHDDGHGREMIALAARFGRGLPADVLPLEVASVGAFGHAEMLGALGAGFAGVSVLLSPRTERAGIEAECALAGALLDGTGHEAGRVALLDPIDPDGLSDALYGRGHDALEVGPILPLGRRRDVTRLAVRALAGGEVAAPIPLPDGAPYGAVLVDTGACTLCLSCAGLCPSGALEDNPDRPELRFKEDACLQCGLCAKICPENAIRLVPQFDPSDDALRLKTLHEEDPYECIECGKPFGVRSTIERIVEKLEGRHALFTNSDNTRLIRMCDDCRVRAQYHQSAAPFAGGPRPVVRTTEDYLKDRDGS